MGHVTVSWRDIKAWAELTEEIVQRWEAELLVKLGMLRAHVLSEGRNGQGSDRTDRELGQDRR